MEQKYFAPPFWVWGGPLSRERVRTSLKKVGYDTTDWIRVVMYRRCFEFIRALGAEKLHALEISGGPQWKREFNFASYSTTQYPDFDICTQTLDQTFDLIIADQVFEHLPDPASAAKNVYRMLRPGGHFVIATPFLVRLHAVPIDCSRWTEQGMSYLLQGAGFEGQKIKTDAWGNRACMKANLKSWKRYGWYRPLRNEANFPLMVWAFAQK